MPHAAQERAFGRHNYTANNGNAYTRNYLSLYYLIHENTLPTALHGSVTAICLLVIRTNFFLRFVIVEKFHEILSGIRAK